MMDDRGSWLTTRLEATIGALGSVATRFLDVGARHSEIPTPTLAHYFYARLLTAAFHLENKQLSAFAAHNDGPFPIFVTTGRAGDEGACARAAMNIPFLGETERPARSVVELTPLAAGSAELGFSTSLSEQLSLPMTVATAGAALDNPYLKYCELFRTLGLNLGTQVGRWRPTAKDTRASNTHTTPPQGPLFLSDGGFSDDLAFYPLLRRSCNHIIIADAAYDPDLLFADYQRLQESLARKGICVTSDELAQHIAQRSIPCDDTDRTDPCFVKANARTKATPFAAARAENSIFFGEVSFQDSSHQPIPFYYVKLSIDAAHPEQYPRAVAAMTHQTPTDYRFPQIPTSQQKIDSAQAGALRLLGCHLIEQLQLLIDDATTIPRDSPCWPESQTTAQSTIPPAK